MQWLNGCWKQVQVEGRLPRIWLASKFKIPILSAGRGFAFPHAEVANWLVGTQRRADLAACVIDA